jgi:DtxR family Mn-dependent transcriptional regulator
MRKELTPAIQDYLKAIYEICSREPRATTSEIAAALGVKPASVTGMAQKLAAFDPPLVDYQKHRGVALTDAGEKVALETMRHHRLVEMFLHRTLGYSWDEVHEEAERLEHVISEDIEERIAEALGHPTHDPHGDPIPSRDLEMPVSQQVMLSELRPGQRTIVERVRDDDPELLRYLSELGVRPGIELEVLGYSPFDDNLVLQIEGQAEPVVLGMGVTTQVFVSHC